MAWTALSFAFGSILTSAKMTQLYDNITAQANGDSGAPKQQTAGIADNALTAAKVVAPVASATYPIGSIGNDIVDVDPPNAYIKAIEFVMPSTGTVRADWSFSNSNDATTVNTRIYVNGAAVGAVKSANASPVAATEASITVASGDLVQLYANASTSDTVEITDFKLSSSVVPIVPVRVPV